MIDERELRDFLERRVARISATPTNAPKAIRRARRRLARNAAVGMLVGLAVLAGAFAGFRTIQAAPTLANTPTPTPVPRDEGSLAYAMAGDVFVADWDGSNAVRIADGRPPDDCRGLGEYWAEGPMWSPDGRYLAYRHTDCDGPRDDWWGVVISDRQGNVVASFPGEGWQIAWSPDSTRVAVWARFEQTIGIYGLDGVRQALLTMPPGWMGAGDVDPVWLPDGESLLVPSDVVVPIDGSRPHHLQLTDRRFAWVTFSPDGSLVAYAANRSFVVAEADGSNPQEVFGDWVFRPVWSPIGDRIAFTLFANAADNDASRPSVRVGVVDVATGTVRMVAEAEGKDAVQAIDFSRDGDRVLFARVEDKGARTSLWSVKVDGSDLHELVTGTAWGDWTPE
jgi:Tol biopolymer transport system component